MQWQVRIAAWYIYHISRITYRITFDLRGWMMTRRDIVQKISLGWLKGDRFFCSADCKLSLSSLSSSLFQHFVLMTIEQYFQICVLQCGEGFLSGTNILFRGQRLKCKIVISPCFVWVKAPLNRTQRLTQMKSKAGFHFEPRNKLPVLQIKVELNQLLTQRSGQHISVHPPETGIGLRLNPVFLLTCLMSFPKLRFSSLFCFLLFWLNVSLFG